MKLLLGVDAGNTKTLALLAREDGTIIGAGRGGSGNMYDQADDGRIPSVEATVAAALAQARIPRAHIDAAGFNMAGADYPEDFVFITRAMEQAGFGRRLTVVNDALGPLRASTDTYTGVVVVCGTGAATGARAADGTTWHSSFWQMPEGGHHLSLQALTAVYQADLGLAEPTLLTERALAFFECRDVAELLHRFTARGQTPPPQTPHFVRSLLDAAQEGDQVATQIVRDHGSALGSMALVAARKVGLLRESFPLVLAGGVLRHPSRLLTDALIERVRRDAPRLCVQWSYFEPVVGALLLAFDALGLSTSAHVRARIAATLPPEPFFATARPSATYPLA